MTDKPISMVPVDAYSLCCAHPPAGAVDEAPRGVRRTCQEGRGATTAARTTAREQADGRPPRRRHELGADRCHPRGAVPQAPRRGHPPRKAQEPVLSRGHLGICGRRQGHGAPSWPPFLFFFPYDRRPPSCFGFFGCQMCDHLYVLGGGDRLSAFVFAFCVFGGLRADAGGGQTTWFGCRRGSCHGRGGITML